MIMNWKGFERKRSWLNFKVLFRHSLGVTEKTTKNLSHVAGRRGRDLNPERPKYPSVQNKMFETRVLYEPYT
jgi:hypothetical protein